MDHSNLHILALGDGKGSGTGDFHDGDGAERVQKHLDAVGSITDLDRHEILAHVNDLGTHDGAVLHDVAAVVPVVFDLDQHKLAAHGLRFAERLDLDDIELLVELLLDLLECMLLPAGDDDHVGDGGIVRFTDGEGVDVEAPPPEKACYLAQDAGPVFNQYGINSFHDVFPVTTCIRRIA